MSHVRCVRRRLPGPALAKFTFSLITMTRKKTFVIPHDKNILAQLFPPAKKLAHDNTFFRVRNLRHMAVGEPALLQK